MQLSIEKKIATGFAVTLAILLVVGVVSYRNTRKLINANRSVAHAQEVINELERTLSIMKDAETGQRGFIITDDEHYLEPYISATSKIDQSLTRLTELIADEPELQSQLPILEQQIRERLKISAESIEKQRAHGFKAGAEVIATGRGKREMDAIRATVAEMSDKESQALERRSSEAYASARDTIITLTILGLLLLAFLPIGYFIIRRDIMLRHQTEAALRESEERYKYLIDHADEIIYRTDTNGHLLFVNPISTKTLKCLEEELIGKHYATLIKPEFREAAEKFFRRQFIEKIPNTYYEVPILAKDGTEIWIGQNTQLVMERNRIVGFQAVARDITERLRTIEELQSLSLTDDLTGLYNRRGFLTLARQQLKVAQRNQEQVILVFADLDGLKQINDRFGHQEGSKAIVKAADVLRQTFRAADILARPGGDEFTVLATAVTDQNIGTIKTRLQQKLDAFNARHELPCDLSMSIGIARLRPQDELSIEELIREADAAMYEHKKERKAKLKI